MRIASSRSSPPSATSAACSAVGEPSCSRRRTATPSTRSRVMRTTSADSDGLVGGAGASAPRAFLTTTAYGSTPCPCRSKASAPGASDGRVSMRRRTWARASPLAPSSTHSAANATRARAVGAAPASAARPPRTAPMPAAPAAARPRWPPHRAARRTAVTGPRSRSCPAAAGQEEEAAAGGAAATRRRHAEGGQRGQCGRLTSSLDGPVHHSTLANTSRSSPSL